MDEIPDLAARHGWINLQARAKHRIAPGRSGANSRFKGYFGLPLRFQELRLAARSLRVERGGRTIVRDVDFDLAPGEALLALGRNGAGKSTLLRALAGLLPLRGGAVTLSGAGAPADAGLPEASHYLGHADGLKSALTALENLEFWQVMLGAAGGVAPLDALKTMGLERIADFPVAYLSAGQKRRVALARLFVAPRPLWILDEPATALDAGAQEVLAQSMAAHRAAGGLIIAATHAPLGLVDSRELRLDARPQPQAGAA